MEDVSDYTMILDVKLSYRHWKEENKGIVKSTSFAAYLKIIGMSYQTASNYQTGLSPHKVLQFAERIQEVTGLSKNIILKRIKSQGDE